MIEKDFSYTQGILDGIGLEKDRLGRYVLELINSSKPGSKRNKALLEVFNIIWSKTR